MAEVTRTIVRRKDRKKKRRRHDSDSEEGEDWDEIGKELAEADRLADAVAAPRYIQQEAEESSDSDDDGGAGGRGAGVGAFSGRAGESGVRDWTAGDVEGAEEYDYETMQQRIRSMRHVSDMGVYAEAEALPRRRLDDSIVPQASDPFLFQVPCIPSKVKFILPVIWQRAMTGYDVNSVFMLEGVPDCLYIEAASKAVVLQVCGGIGGCRAGQMTLVNPENQVPLILGSMGSIVPAEDKQALVSQSWVVVKKPPLYKDDLGYVSAVFPEDDTALVAVRPRVPIADLWGPHAYGGRRGKGIARPAPRLFSYDDAIRAIPADVDRELAIRTEGGNYVVSSERRDLTFNKAGYLLITVPMRWLSRCTIPPTWQQLRDYYQGSDVPPQMGALSARFEADLAAYKYRGGDPVVITRGPHAGTLGEVQEHKVGNDILVRLRNSGLPPLGFPPKEVRKLFERGAHVRISQGDKRGASGQVYYPIIRGTEKLPPISPEVGGPLDWVGILLTGENAAVRVLACWLQGAGQTAVTSTQSTIGPYSLNDVVRLVRDPQPQFLLEIHGNVVTLMSASGDKQEIAGYESIATKLDRPRQGVSDAHGSNFSVNDLVTALAGPHKGKEARVLGIARDGVHAATDAVLWAQLIDGTSLDRGIVVLPSSKVRCQPGKQRRGGRGGGGGARSDYLAHAQAMQRRTFVDSSLIHKNVVVLTGEHRQRRGKVIAESQQDVTVMLHYPVQNIVVRHDDVRIADESTQDAARKLLSRQMRGPGGAKSFLSAQTPMGFGEATPALGMTPGLSAFGSTPSTVRSAVSHFDPNMKTPLPSLAGSSAYTPSTAPSHGGGYGIMATPMSVASQAVSTADDTPRVTAAAAPTTAAPKAALAFPIVGAVVTVTGQDAKYVIVALIGDTATIKGPVELSTEDGTRGKVLYLDSVQEKERVVNLTPVPPLGMEEHDDDFLLRRPFGLPSSCVILLTRQWLTKGVIVKYWDDSDGRVLFSEKISDDEEPIMADGAPEEFVLVDRDLIG